MIEISRSLLRVVRSVFRRAGIGKAQSGPNSLLQIQAADDGLRIRGGSHEVVIEYHLAGQFSPEQVSVPFQFVEDCYGTRDQPVRLEAIDETRVTATWVDKAVPQLIEYRLDKQPVLQLPALPERFSRSSPELLTALRSAGATTDSSDSRYALTCVQLRGSAGQIAATDGRQAFWQSGLDLPWKGELLLPFSAVWKSAEFTQQPTWQIGQAGDWLTLRGGPWTVWQRIQREGRYPKLDDVLPSRNSAVGSLQVDQQDTHFLRESISRLPCHDEQHYPVTLDLNGHVSLRAKDAADRITEVTLAHSRYSGEPLAVSINRRYLERAIQLGFQEFKFFGAGNLVLCDDGQRQLLWMLLAANDLIKAKPDMVRISSAGTEPGNRVSTDAATDSPKGQSASRRTSSPEPRRTIPLQNNTNDKSERVTATTPVGNGQPASLSPIEQAEALRSTLREAVNQTGELIASLRRQRKQGRLMKATLDSLKELQRVAG